MALSCWLAASDVLTRRVGVQGAAPGLILGSNKIPQMAGMRLPNQPARGLFSAHRCTWEAKVEEERMLEGRARATSIPEAKSLSNWAGARCTST